MLRRMVFLVLSMMLIGCGGTTAGTTGGSPSGALSGSPEAPTPPVAAVPTAPVQPPPSPSPQASPAGQATPMPTAPTATKTQRPTAGDTATAVAARCTADRDLNVFAAGLLRDMALRDAGALEAAMGKSFTFVVEATDVTIPDQRARGAVRTLLTGLRADGFLGQGGRPEIVPLARAAKVRCEPGVPLDDATGAAILGRPYDAAFLTTGWGKRGDEEAYVFLARNADGRIVWRGVWYSTTGFER